MTGHEALYLLNATDSEAHVEVTVFHADCDPVGPFRLAVPARRFRRARMNDLMHPEALPLETDYAGLVESDVPIVIQFRRLDPSRAENAIRSSMAFPDAAAEDIE
jgi:hypothetical protein